MKALTACMLAVASALPLASPELGLHMGMQRGTQLIRSFPYSQSTSETGAATYAVGDDHPWNRLYRLFYVRVAQNGHRYGGDELDPFLWPETEYLLSGASHYNALK